MIFVDLSSFTLSAVLRRDHQYRSCIHQFLLYLSEIIQISTSMALRLLKGVRELRFVLCQSSSHSQTLRKYLATNYEAVRSSPAKITVRECENVSPSLIATFNYGIQKTVDLRKLSASQIEEAIGGLQSYSQQLSKTIKI